MEVFSNSHDVIKILFPDWSINKFIVMHRKAHKVIVIETYLGFMNMKNSTDTLKNIYDVIKILFAGAYLGGALGARAPRGSPKGRQKERKKERKRKRERGEKRKKRKKEEKKGVKEEKRKKEGAIKKKEIK